MFSFLRNWRPGNELLYSIQIFIALMGAVGFPWWFNHISLMLPLVLGVVAAALSEIDDRMTGRLRNLMITLSCFLLASLSV